MVGSEALVNIEIRIVEEIFARSEAYENLLVLADDNGIRFSDIPSKIKAKRCPIRSLHSPYRC